MSKEIDKLLKVLGLTHQEQEDWIIDKFYDNVYPLGWTGLFADLAFRLRDEAFDPTPEKGLQGLCWEEGKDIVRKHFNMNERWFDDMAQPIHWIIAALIAKELAKENYED